MTTLFCDTETDSLNPYTGKLQMIGFAIDDDKVNIIDMQDKEEYLIEWLKDLLYSKDILKVFHHANFDLLFLNLNGFKTCPQYFDTQLYFHIQDPYSSSKLKDLGESILKMEVKRLNEIIQTKEEPGLIKIGCKNTRGYGYVKKEVLESYLRQDVSLTRDLYRYIEKKGITDYYARIEQPIIQPILEMELRGLKIDSKKLKILDFKLSKEIKTLERYFALKQINPRSPVKVREYISHD